jgi:hypothetical protein
MHTIYLIVTTTLNGRSKSYKLTFVSFKSLNDKFDRSSISYVGMINIARARSLQLFVFLPYSQKLDYIGEQ